MASDTLIVHPGELTEHPANSNTHDRRNLEELAESRRLFGQYKNIVVWEPPEEMTVEVNGSEHTLKPGIKYVIAGNGFHQASLLRGDDSIEVKDYSHLSYDEAVLLMETDNASPLGGKIDPDRMRLNLERVRGLTADNERMSRMLERARELRGANGRGGGGGDGNTEPPPLTEIEAEKYHKRWQAKQGDVWRLGNHTIACLDSLERENIEQLTQDKAIAGVFADPPYGISIVAANGYVGGGEAYDIPFGGVKNCHRRRIPVGGGSRHKDKTGKYYIEDWKPAATDGGSGRSKPFGGKEYRAANGGGSGRDNVVEQGKYYPVIGDDTTETAKRAVSLYLELFPDACHFWWGGNYYTDILPPSPCWVIWDKDNTGNFADCEMAWTNQPTAARIFEHRWNGMLKASEHGQRRIHPTQKPVALAEWCFENYTEANDIILDPFLGSGITVLAAEKLGDRTVVGYELEPVYISVILERYHQLTNRQPERLT